ncbi:TerB family tellurite resistance protein [uncultured Pelagimonas sp.]|uniref:TerB family tellurite resistance protein n=1 Tax=uncultured Pelagimonas sp. TaxID=1618102 RepID=UPI0026328917|nr:TerB family tellurite resistance protein [uncultured Pelagimonas sp.]
MFFKKAKKALEEKSNRLQGRTDLLEAVCAAAALVANADNDISDAEVDATVKAVKANTALAGAFSPSDIDKNINTALTTAGGGRVGQRQLMKEIEDISGDADDGEIIILTALDIAEADGDICDDEMKVLKKIGDAVGQNVENFI